MTIDLIKPPRATRLPDIVTIEEAAHNPSRPMVRV